MALWVLDAAGRVVTINLRRARQRASRSDGVGLSFKSADLILNPYFACPVEGLGNITSNIGALISPFT